MRGNYCANQSDTELFKLLCYLYFQVRWADLEERKNQERMRDIGFVVGQTDWNMMMDESHADRALNRTKYI